jgi:hypothetical protein
MVQILKFENYAWEDIPTEGNPLFDYVNDDRLLGRKNDYLLIYKVLPHERSIFSATGHAVSYVPKKGRMKSLGMFWNIENTEIFANAAAAIFNK